MASRGTQATVLRDSQSRGSSGPLHGAREAPAAAAPPPWPGSGGAPTGSAPGWKTAPAGDRTWKLAVTEPD